MEQDTTAAMPVIDSGKQKDRKGWKIATVIASVLAVCGIGFGIYGVMAQGSAQESPNCASCTCEDSQEGVVLVRPLEDIDQWQVDSFVVDDQVKYQALNDSYITDDQEEGWLSLLREINIVCHTKNPKIHPGETAHTEVSINMKNGNVYNLLWLGNQNQVDITTPNGTTTEYQCYHN